MSILDSRTDLEEAKLKLGTGTDEELVRDLAYWSVRELDHHADMADLQERFQTASILHAEADRWVGLIAAEIRTRRDAKRARADG